MSPKIDVSGSRRVAGTRSTKDSALKAARAARAREPPVTPNAKSKKVTRQKPRRSPSAPVASSSKPGRSPSAEQPELIDEAAVFAELNTIFDDAGLDVEDNGDDGEEEGEEEVGEGDPVTEGGCSFSVQSPCR